MTITRTRSRRKLSSLAALVGLLAVGLFAVTPAVPASATAMSCHAYGSSLYKSDSTIIGKLTITCNQKSSEIRILGYLSKGGDSPRPTYRICNNVSTCTQILGRADSPGSQRYVVMFDTEDTQVMPAEFCPDMVCNGLAKNF